MNKETAEYVSELIRNTIKYLHQQEVVLLQLASQIEVDHGIERPGQSPTVYPHDETEDQKSKSEDSDYQYAFPWGRRKKPESTNGDSNA